jgi:hypothetical protein
MHNPAPPEISPLCNQALKAWFWIEQQGLEVAAGGSLQPIPILDRDKNRSFSSLTGYDLRSFLERRVQEFAETRLCVL